MDFAALHDWDLDPRQAVALQRELARQVRLMPADELPATVAGVDVSYEKHGDHFFAAVVVLDFATLTVLDEASADGRVDFPYIPGLLSFRELPVLLAAFRRLKTVPDVVLVDGQGIAHPRRIGLASHLGLWLNLPTVGCAKSRLCGVHAELGAKRGEAAPLLLADEVVGMALRTRERVKPLYVSPGHLTDVASATRLTLACTRRYRMPEPTRLAHHLTNQLRKAALSN